MTDPARKPSLDDCLKKDEVARKYRVSKRTVELWMQKRIIRYIKPGRDPLFRPQDLAEFEQNFEAHVEIIDVGRGGQR